MSANLDIRLNRVNKTYHEQEDVLGVIVIDSRSEVKHEGITLSLDGTVTMQLSAKNVGILEAFYSSVKPVQLAYCSLEIAKPGRLPAGKTEIPFELPLKPKGNKTLYETYHGVFISIQVLKTGFCMKEAENMVHFCIFHIAGGWKKSFPHRNQEWQQTKETSLCRTNKAPSKQNKLFSTVAQLVHLSHLHSPWLLEEEEEDEV